MGTPSSQVVVHRTQCTPPPLCRRYRFDPKMCFFAIQPRKSEHVGTRERTIEGREGL